MNRIHSIVVAILIVACGLVACNSGDIRRNPGKTYAPDMTYSRAYETYTANPNFADSQTSRQPVAGAIALGHELPDHLMEGDTTAYKTYTTKLRFAEAELKEGERLFNINCAICHGPNLDGQGPLYTSGKFAAMPANLKDAKYLHMPIGTMYAAVKYGKNAMGSYASQLDIKQRWQVLAYVKKVQAENGGEAFTLGSDSTAKKATDTTKVATAATKEMNKKG